MNHDLNNFMKQELLAMVRCHQSSDFLEVATNAFIYLQQ